MRARMLFTLVAVMVLSTLVAPRVARAVDCYFEDAWIAPECTGSGHCIIFYIAELESGDCGTETHIDLQRRVVGSTGAWTTVATGISSPYTYCPPAISLGTIHYEFRVKGTCSENCPTQYHEFGEVDCP